MKKSRYRRYFSEEIIEGYRYPEVTSPAVRYTGDGGGEDLVFDWTCVTQPMTVGDVPRHADRDQFILFAGTDLENLREFGAEVYLSLGPEKTRHVVTEPKLVYIQRGLAYGPLELAEFGAQAIRPHPCVHSSDAWQGRGYR